MKKYQLLLTCEYQEQVEIHVLHIGNLHTCKAVQLLAKRKQKQFIKEGAIPQDTKMTYKIERYNEV